MKLQILSIDNQKTGEIELPVQFDEEKRPDLVKKAVLALQSHKRQPFGASPDAGKRSSSILSKRRHNYRGMYGFGISRTPRKILSRRGTRMNWVGAFAPNTVGGRRAHPPKAEKNLWLDINKKERKKAIRSAISSTVSKESVAERGHKVPQNYPFILDIKIENIDKTKDVKDILIKIGLKEELDRVKLKKVRAGKGKSRGRKYQKKVGPLIVVSKDCKILKSAPNIQGVDVVEVKNLNAELLAPGTSLGRLTLWSKAAIEKLSKDKLFM